AMHQALLILAEEGLRNSWDRHIKNHLMLHDGLQNLGIEYFVEEEYRLPQLNAVKVPKDVDEVNVRNVLLNEYSLEIGAGLGPLAGQVWRIGLMGYASRKENVDKCLVALDNVLE
ncbi:MAG: hypothetical protein MRY83_15285, partial [Flavobacteriales bacterium]|nr:hypothetical protein [Flavobacteriales bacterium]